MDYSIEFDTLVELLDAIKEFGEKENIIFIDIRKTPNGYSAIIHHTIYEGIEGQDRENYVDEQDRKFYTIN